MVGISELELSDFRAFPALAPFRYNLEGRNLLVFGENGSGKSSIYRALRGLFSVDPPAIADFRNMFSDPPEPVVRAVVDDVAVEWTMAGHPSAEVRGLARRAAFLSHRRLIELNTGTDANTPPNLFEVAVRHLLADFEATIAGGVRRTIAELWGDVQEALAARIQVGGRERRGPKHSEKVLLACERFNEGMHQAVDALETRAQPLLVELLTALSPDALELVGLQIYELSYDSETQKLINDTLTARVSFRGYSPPAPQNFLNEARQTALGIAIYLAARLVCVPQYADGSKLLVLDDLLISLDNSHRRPVLEVISRLFDTWQIILLTHDRFWFELAREQLGPTWKAIEVFEEIDGDGLLRPVVRESGENLVALTLAQARAFIAAHHPAAAANYTRAACELALRRYCKKHGIEFPYVDDPQKITLNMLMQRGRLHAQNDAGRMAAFDAITFHQKYTLNPLSHNPVEPVVAADVIAAIDAVQLLVAACAR
ncbi:MAG: hypothetical protein C0500_05000 [Sphingobium sp.]|nr:hypothetical protein [Sphingobium sp.]